MSSYLAVAFFGGGAVLEVESFEDCVFAEALFDVDEGFLYAPFFGQLVGVGVWLFFVAVEEAELVAFLDGDLDGVVFFGDDVEGGDGDAPDEEEGVDVVVVDVEEGVGDDGRGGGGDGQ